MMLTDSGISLCRPSRLLRPSRQARRFLARTLLLARANIGVLLLVPVLMALFPPAARAQASITGFWLLRVLMGDGNYRETFLDLKQAGDNVTGKVLLGRRELPVHEGSFKDGHLHLLVSWRRQ